jgi:hypothetical protein
MDVHDQSCHKHKQHPRHTSVSDQQRCTLRADVQSCDHLEDMALLFLDTDVLLESQDAHKSVEASTVRCRTDSAALRSLGTCANRECYADTLLKP